MKGVVKVGAYNADVHKQFAGKYEVRGFPTVKFFGLDKKLAATYESERSAEALVKYTIS